MLTRRQSFGINPYHELPLVIGNLQQRDFGSAILQGNCEWRVTNRQTLKLIVIQRAHQMGRSHYAVRCYDLAELFLSDEPLLDNEERRQQLANQIQTFVKDEIASMRREEEEYRRLTRRR